MINITNMGLYIDISGSRMNKISETHQEPN